MHPPEPHAFASGRPAFASCTATSASMCSTSATSIAQRRSTIMVGCVRQNCARCGRIHAVPRPSVTEQRTMPRVVRS